MWITDQDLDLDIEPRRSGAMSPRDAGAAPQCECPDFCLVQHDNDN